MTVDACKTVFSLFFIPLVVLLGTFFSFRFRFIQCTHFIKAWKYFLNDRYLTHKRVSSFSAVAASLGGNLGTGNISGIAVALSLGGPGALFWMWVMAFLGAILKFLSCALGVLYRHKEGSGRFVGGPMYYLAQCAHPKLAKLYCLLTIGATFTVGAVQMNSLALPLTQTGISPLASGMAMSFLIAAVLLGGLRSFSRVASTLVPFMAITYILSCLIILFLHYDQLGAALHIILQAAFHPTAVGGGITGYTVLTAIKVGFDRGVFATDTGLGIDAIIHASVESDRPLTQNALIQGIISTLSPLIVMLVCTLTGLVLIVTRAWKLPLESTNLCVAAFQQGFSSPLAGHLVTLTLCLFAFTTLLTWSFCGERALHYLCAGHGKWLQCAFILWIPFGAFLHVHWVWTIADLFLNGMVIINLIGLASLYKEVLLLFDTTWRKRVSLTPY